MSMTRREALAALGLAVAGAPAVFRGRYRLFAQPAAEYSARAIRLVQAATVVDLLNQFQFPDFSVRPPKSEQWLTLPGSFTAADAARYKDSGITVFALGHGAGDYDRAIRFFADWNGFLAAHSEWFTRIDDASDFARAKAAGKVGVMLTFQDSTHFRTPDDVRTFFGLGQRISQLTYNFNNRIGSGFLEERDGGLSVFGLSILERMQQVGMAVDVSHCGDQTTLDALAAAKKPVIFTHATARALVPGHLRCKTDEAIQKMAKTGGVMGIAMIRFMVRGVEPVTAEHVLDHVDHVARLVGVEHVAIGSDMDVVGNPNAINGGGFDPKSQPNFARYQYHEDTDGAITIKGLNHPKRVFDLTEGLIRRAYSDADIGLILGGNAVRVLGGIWGA
jgi:membrane dipeptidase